MQPILQTKRPHVRTSARFRGLCLKEAVPEGYFSVFHNLCLHEYPAVSTRRLRKRFTECGNITAMYMHDLMVWVQDTTLYYGGTTIGTVAAGKKQIAAMGTKVIIWPDKLVLDTLALTLSPMGFSQTVSSVSVSPVDREGNAVSNEDAGYAKFSASGIGQNIREGDGITVSGFSNTACNGVFLVSSCNENEVIFCMENAQAITGTNITLARAIPDGDFIAAYNNRLWCADSQSHTLYASKLGDALNWNVFEGLSTDSYAVSVPTAGAFTGISTKLGNLMLFKENEIIKLFGTRPGNFQLSYSSQAGVSAASAGALCAADGILYFVGVLGIYAYDGSQTVCISGMLGNLSLRSAVCGAIGHNVYIYGVKDVNTNVFYIYNTDTNAWQTDSQSNITLMAETGSELYLPCSNGNVYNINDSGLWYSEPDFLNNTVSEREATLSWQMETGPICAETPLRTRSLRLSLCLKLGNAATCTVSVKTDTHPQWMAVKTLTGPLSEQTITLPAPAQKHSVFYLKLAGVGEMSLLSVSETYLTEADA